MSLRRRIEKSERLASALAWIVGGYLSLCNRTTRWQTEGLDELKAALDKGPVLVVTWHSRTLMPSLHWPLQEGALSTLHDKSPIGRVTGALQRRLGLKPMEMSRKRSNRAASREVLKRVHAGVSIGMTADGPLGPAMQVKDAPLDWARITGLPIFCYGFSTRRGRRLSSWDQMLVPKPFGKGAYVFAPFEGKAKRKMEANEREALRSDLQAALTAAAHRADQLVGVTPGN